MCSQLSATHRLLPEPVRAMLDSVFLARLLHAACVMMWNQEVWDFRMEVREEHSKPQLNTRVRKHYPNFYTTDKSLCALLSGGGVLGITFGSRPRDDSAGICSVFF